MNTRTMLVLLALLSFCIVYGTKQKSTVSKKPKIIGLVAQRNEGRFLAQTLKALSLCTDALVVLDDASTDHSVEIIESLQTSCNIKTIIKKTEWYRDEPADRNKLLEAGRALGGTHFLVLDADELITANCIENNYLRTKLLNLKPGERLSMPWIHVWNGISHHRVDGIFKEYLTGSAILGFCDNGHARYKSEFIHTTRAPHSLQSKIIFTDADHGVVHFNFYNWRNLLIKQSWYRCLEHIRLPKKPITEINARYDYTKNTQGLTLAPTNPRWFAYSFFDPSPYQLPELWREQQVMGWFDDYGKEYFKDLDIWDIQWGTYEAY
jgi:glycosyltransferase involved in cell wall biosynthesis